MSSILVTGGAGYIGSHTVIELLRVGHDIVIVDNLSNAKREVVNRIKKIANRSLAFYEIDVRDKEAMTEVFEEHDIDAVIHFAGLKAVGESVAKPIEYYHNNITGSLILFDVMRQHNVKRLVFSSSATVYGMHNESPLTEDLPLSATNPYGYTKIMIEQMIHDLYVADKEWRLMNLRYFNPIGAHETGLIGEDPSGIPSNLMPYITQVAVGQLKELSIYGDDYETVDGTGVRDYIHVVDLAVGHVKAVEYIMKHEGIENINLGTGKGYSVIEVVKSFVEANGIQIPYVIKERRPGDIGTCYADNNKALSILGWQAKKNMIDMCKDSWRWQSLNPNGYEVSR